MILKSELLEKTYDSRKVVKGVSVNIHSGEVCGLLGPNGAGKTTTFHMLMGFTHPDDGKVLIDEKDVSNMPMFERARMGIGFLSQDPTVFKGLTVQENLIAILERTISDNEAICQKVDNLLKEFGLIELKKQKAWS
ncbi:MAG: ATP-binding cassette domain-containing protein, partial [Elusimicrobiales bacterium]|nr:ATP-binding cassette domain-containing protein [Elusimicrobiales bacterium]